MSENINISFTPNRRAAENDRVTAVEDHLKLLTDRTKFCLSSINDDFSEVSKELKKLESYSLTMPSSTNLNVDSAVILQEQESQQIIHNFTKTHYVKGNNIGYGDMGNSIVVGGYLAYRLAMGAGNPVEALYSEISFPKVQRNTLGDEGLYNNVKFYLHIYRADTNYKTFLPYFTADGNLISDGWSDRFNAKSCALGIIYNTIYPPNDIFEYGSVDATITTFDTEKIEQDSGNGAHAVRLPFASEAEYNAAIGLTNSPLELIKIQDFQYLMPESQVIVDKALSPDSDNVIANSAVAKALDLKADKTALETLSLEVDSKANTVDVDAISEQVNAKADKTEVQSIAQALGDKADSSVLVSHTGDTENPHKVTKEQIGLSKVENKSSADILSELHVGGRNYLINSNFSRGRTNWVLDEGCTIDETTRYLGNKTLKIDVEGATQPIYIGGICNRNLTDNPFSIKKGEIITYSVDYFVSSSKTYNSTFSAQFSGIPNGSDASTVFLTANLTLDSIVKDRWSRFVYTFEAQEDYSDVWVNSYISRNGLVWLANFKVEKGNKATDWSPAPEDTASYEQRIAALEAAILSLGGET